MSGQNGYIVELLSSEDEREQDDIDLVSVDGNQNNTRKILGKKHSFQNNTCAANVLQTSDVIDIIEIDDISSSQESSNDKELCNQMKNKVFNPYSEINTRKFRKFYNLCLKLDSSDSMKKIIQKNLKPAFKNADENYLNSKAFLKFLSRLYNNMKIKINMKYQILKELVDALMSHKMKKRVDFITLDSSTQKSNEINNKIKLGDASTNSKELKKQFDNGIPTIIDSDNGIPTIIGSDNGIPTIIDSDNEDVNVLLDVEEPSPQIPCKNHQAPSKKLQVPSNILQVQNINIDSKNDENRDIENEYLKEDSLLTVTKQFNVNINEKEQHNTEEIEYLESKLKHCHEKIKLYDEMEIAADDNKSPYIQADNWKAKSVRVYRKLCQLTGSSSTIRKAKLIRLQVAEGHPPGPARKLEKWLNTNKDGSHYVLPDIVDVINCVEEANVKDGLEWSSAEIIHEARSLFHQCGTLIQKWRKRREWRDLVTSAQTIPDPALEDPALLAKLDQNRLIAKRKETDLLEHYANLEMESKKRKKSSKPDTINQVSGANINENNNPEQYSLPTTTESNNGEEHNINKFNNSDTDSSAVTKQLNNSNLYFKTKENNNNYDNFGSSSESQTEISDNDIAQTKTDSRHTKLNETHTPKENVLIDKLEAEDDKYKINMKTEKDEVIDGTAEFIKQYGDLSEKDIVAVSTIIFNPEPTVTIDISSDSNSDASL